MKRAPSWFGVLAIFALVAGGGALVMLNYLDAGRTVATPFKGVCAPVAGIAGPEDLQIDPQARRAFVSSFDRDSAERKTPPRGGVYVFSIDDPLADDAWRDRTGGTPTRFEPVGLSFYDDGAVRRLFVANAASSSVELYSVEDNGDLAYIETFRERRLTSPNDVVATGPRSFYVTNDLEPGRNSLLGKAQFIFRTPSGRVMQFDGVAWSVAAEGLRFANGIAMSRDGKRVYVAETAAAALRIYDRDRENGALYLTETAPMGAAPDNMNIDQSGALWIGARPRSLLPHAISGAKSKAASVVLRYDDMAGVPSKPKAVFVDDGEKISASTVAARLGPALLIGSPFEKKFLICDLQ